MQAATAASGRSALAIDAGRLAVAVTRIFSQLGVKPEDARTVTDDLVAADLEGVASHGVMLVPMYVDRMLKGSVSLRSEGDIVSDRGAAIVLDAGNALGQLTARQAVRLAVRRAKELGLAAVAVRNAFHFGTAGRYARMMAEQDCIGIVMSNTRPLMPAPGGAEALAGNNPLAIALPSAGDYPVEIDMAMSATAMGKIRLAAAAGKPIPPDWAIDSEGLATTDPAAAIKGMLLPAAGPKGFGLAFVIDLLCGGLSDGAVGADVRPLYGDAAEPYRCSQFFLAIHAPHFADRDKFAERVREQASKVSASKRAPGIERIYAPGELAFAAREASAGKCRLSTETAQSLLDAARRAGIEHPENLLSEGTSA